MTLDEQIKMAQLEKLNRELSLMPRSKLSLEVLSRLFVPILAVAAAGYAFWIGLPKSQLDLLRAQKEIVDSERKLAEARQSRDQAESTRARLLADIEDLRKTFDGIQKQNANTELSLNSLRRESTDPQAMQKIDNALAQVARVDTSLTAAGEQLSVAAISAAAPGERRYGAYKVDIFYCANAGSEAKSRAEAVLAMGAGQTSGFWEARVLTADKNREPGYRIARDVIRHNPDERGVADKLSADIRSTLKIGIVLQSIAYPTPGYISVFFCEGARI